MFSRLVPREGVELRSPSLWECKVPSDMNVNTAAATKRHSLQKEGAAGYGFRACLPLMCLKYAAVCLCEAQGRDTAEGSSRDCAVVQNSSTFPLKEWLPYHSCVDSEVALRFLPR